MRTNKQNLVVLIFIACVFGIGLWNALNGMIAFGASLIGASIASGVLRYLKEKRIAKLKAKGLDPHDERVAHINGLASILTINIILFLMAIIVLVGSVIGPEVMFNPYDLLGFCLAITVIIYLSTFYYYSKRF